MDKDLQNIDHFFRSSIESYQEMPSQQVFHNITVFLDGQQKKSTAKNRIFHKAAIIILFLMLTFILSDVCRKSIPSKTVYAPTNEKESASTANTDITKKIISKEYSIPQIVSKGAMEKYGAYKLQTNEIADEMIDARVSKEEKIEITANPEFDLSKAVALSLKNILKPALKNAAPLNDINESASGKKDKIEQTQKFKPYISVTPFLLAESAKYNLENNAAQENNNKDYKNVFENEEKHELSFSTGALLNYQFKQAVSLQTGFIYSNTVINIDPHYLYAVKQPSGTLAYKYNSSSGYAYLDNSLFTPSSTGDSIGTTAAQHNLKYLSMPVMLKYKIGSNKIYFAPSIGVTLNLLLASSIHTEVQSNSINEQISITKLQGLKRSYIGYTINTELGYNTKTRFAINLQSSCSYSLTPINKTNVVKTFPYSFGIGIGIRYRF